MTDIHDYDYLSLAKYYISLAEPENDVFWVVLGRTLNIHQYWHMFLIICQYWRMIRIGVEAQINVKPAKLRQRLN